MVVVADQAVGDAAHDMPICNAPNERDEEKPNEVLDRAKIYGKFLGAELAQEELTEKTIVIVGDKKVNVFELHDPTMTKRLRIEVRTQVTVDQIKYIISKNYPDFPSINSFDICIPFNGDHDHKIVLENATINKRFKSRFTTEVIDLEILHRKGNDEDIPVKYCSSWDFIEFVLENPPDKTITKDIHFYAKESTKVCELYDSLLKADVESLYNVDLSSMAIYSGGIVITYLNRENTLREMGLLWSPGGLHVPMVIKKLVTVENNWNSSSGVLYKFSYVPYEYRGRVGGRNRYSTIINGEESEGDERPPPTFTVENSEPDVKSAEDVYVGLVNQAMTCYLNSLLQALFMTPEFRNALYNWEYVEGPEKDESNSIPYQLQKLFLNLQTSTKNAVETTALTKSFGWDSTEAWQQHDIQELCRVMLDSLEQKFKNTEQADLINRLYEGKMIDYVKCLECKNEKTREDTFLDIPLPVKPFGSNVAYNSVEEALRAFVQPETLEGVNQYFCETCNKKCNAHKGLKFTKFPYLLTLHLKRFDFDYSTLHRIKLNDKVTFPDTLNLNSFIPTVTCNQESPLSEDESTDIKDDESPIDNGNVDDGLPCDNGASSSEATNSSTEQNDDDGIDVSHCPSTSSTHSQEYDHRNNSDCSGPYQYELFSIMIHSGGAGGGHYYAYIKDFKTQEWLCFNDQNVSSITPDDIQRTYGGGPSRAYYNGAYSSSTNAYMLMYRQIDPERNTLPMRMEDFPKHLQEVLMKMKKHEHSYQKKAGNMCRITVYCHHPVEKKMMNTRIFALVNDKFSTITEIAYRQLNLEKVVDLDQCRLVSYNSKHDVVDCSLEKYDTSICEVMHDLSKLYPEKQAVYCDMLLEIKRRDEKFKVYLPVEIVTKVFLINVATEKIEDGPIIVRAHSLLTLLEYKKLLIEYINYPHCHLYLVIRKWSGKAMLLENDFDNLENLGLYNGCKVYIANKVDMNPTKPYSKSTFKQMVDRFEHLILLNIQLPDTNSETLEDLNIPSLESKQKEKVDKVTAASSTKYVNGEAIKVKKHDEVALQKKEECPSWNSQLQQQAEGEECQERSNSEESSLSDSDKTLVGDASLDDEVCWTNVDREFFDFNTKNWNADDYFFQVKSEPEDIDDCLQVFVDNRIGYLQLKKHLEPYVKVPAEYLKIERIKIDYRSRKGIGHNNFEDGENLVAKLDSVLRDNEFKVKIFHLSFDTWKTTIMEHLVCECVISKDTTVEQTKKEILAVLKNNHSIKIPYDNCRLRKREYKNGVFMPPKVFHDDEIIKDLDIHSEFGLIVQELSDPEIIKSSDQIVILVREDKEDSPHREIVLNSASVEELRTKLVELTDCSAEKMEVIEGFWMYPQFGSLPQSWISATSDFWSITLEDGAVIFYRFTEEVEDENLTNATKLIHFDKGRSHRQSGSPASGYPRRERALKIYVDDK